MTFIVLIIIEATVGEGEVIIHVHPTLATVNVIGVQVIEVATKIDLEEARIRILILVAQVRTGIVITSIGNCPVELVNERVMENAL